MRAVTKLGLSFVLCAGWSLPVLAQTQTAEAAQAEAARLESVNLVITNKEVSAVQAALLGRGYYSGRPNGTLNAETRESLRAFQADNNLAVTGRIDRPTLAGLEVNYPATGKEADSARRNGMFAKAGYAVKDNMVAGKNAVTGTTHKAVNGVKTGVNYSKDKTVGAARYTRDKTVGAARYSRDKTVGAARFTKDKTTGVFTRGKNVSVGVGESTAGGVKTAGRKTGGVIQRTSTAVVGRSDLDIQTQVREVLDTDPAARKFTTSVKDGNVTVKVPPGYQADYGGVIASIRRVNGVKSGFVVQP